MKLKCEGCQFNEPLDYCSKLKEVMPNGFAKLYYSKNVERRLRK